ncbi:hypothetical protein NKG05_07775 [Oerskovia sp. M15]
MTIADDFAGFDGDINVLRRRLRESGAQIRDHFPEYGRDFRRLLGIESEQAMELFHQTVSMKSVGDLNEFVREHMLEPFDAARWTEKLVAHFDDLTSAHDAVVKARAQIDQLAPLLGDADAYDAVGERVRVWSPSARRCAVSRRAAASRRWTGASVSSRRRSRRAPTASTASGGARAPRRRAPAPRGRARRARWRPPGADRGRGRTTRGRARRAPRQGRRVRALPDGRRPGARRVARRVRGPARAHGRAAVGRAGCPG